MNKLIILVGCCGSGKSYYCKDLPDYIRISQDEQGKIKHFENFLLAIKERRDIIVDRMGFNKEQRARYIEPARKEGYHIKIVYFDVSNETCYKRIKNRKEHPTLHEDKALKVIDFYHKNFQYPIKEEYNEFEVIKEEDQEEY